MKIIHLMTAAAVALSAPALVDGSGIPSVDQLGAAYAGNGNGKGNGQGKGQGSSNAGGNASKAGKSATSGGGASQGKGSKGTKTASKGPTTLKQQLNKAARKLGLAPKATRTQKVARTSPAKKASPKPTHVAKSSRPVLAPREKNLHAQLKGLNSLNRNANGFFNGKDAKLDPLRDFVAASVVVDGLERALADAQGNLLGNQATLDALAAELGLTAETTAEQRAELEGLREGLLANEPAADDPAYADWEAELAALDDGIAAVDAVEADAELVAAAEQALEETDADVSDEALRQAIADAMNATGNGSIAPEDVSDEVVDFVSDKLGVDEAEGFIDVAIEAAEAAEADELLEDDETALDDAENGVEEPLQTL